MQHRVDDHVAVLESRIARRHEVFVGQVDVLSVERMLSIFVQLLPNIGTSFHLHDVGGSAKVTRLDDADLKVQTELVSNL